MAEPYVSEIRMFAAEEPPDGWVPCDGRLLAIQEEDHQALFALIHTTFGGDGRTTFAVPDLRDRVPLGESKDRPRGQAGGAVEHKLAPEEMPKHRHGAFGEDVAPAGGSGEQPGPDRVLSNSDPVPLYGPPDKLKPMLDDVIRPVGGTTPHPNEQPSLAVAFFIAFKGLFPPQDGAKEAAA